MTRGEESTFHDGPMSQTWSTPSNDIMGGNTTNVDGVGVLNYQRALDIARNTEGELNPNLRDYLEQALNEIWGRIQQQPDSYILTKDEFAMFNYYHQRCEGFPEAQEATARYLDFSSKMSPRLTTPHCSEVANPPDVASPIVTRRCMPCATPRPSWAFRQALDEYVEATHYIPSADSTDEEETHTSLLGEESDTDESEMPQYVVSSSSDDSWHKHHRQDPAVDGEQRDPTQYSASSGCGSSGGGKEGGSGNADRGSCDTGQGGRSIRANGGPFENSGNGGSGDDGDTGKAGDLSQLTAKSGESYLPCPCCEAADNNCQGYDPSPSLQKYALYLDYSDT